MSDTKEKLLLIGEYAASGMYEDEDASLFERKARGIRRYYENCHLQKYNGEWLYPSGEYKPDCIVFVHHWTGLDIQYDVLKSKSQELADILKHDFAAYSSSVPVEHTVTGNMYTHSIPNYSRIEREGLDSYEKRIMKMKNDPLREGLLDVLKGIREYHNRCLDYLRESGARPELIEAFTQVPFRSARNLYEALVCRNFIMYFDNCDNLGSMVYELAPYYKGENVTDVLSNLFDNIDLSDGYSLSIFDECPELALQCLEAVKGKRRPMIELFVDENTPQEIWKAAFESVRTGNGQPAFYNEKMLDRLKERFPEIRDEDRHRFCGGGCAEAMFSGLSNVGSIDAGINLMLVFEGTMHEKLELSESFEQFTEYVLNDIKDTLFRIGKEVYNSQKLRAEKEPLPLRTLLVDDCIDKETEFNAGGPRYCWSVINYGGPINLIDSMMFIKEHVYDKKDISAAEVIRRCDGNDKEFLAACRKTELHYGSDIPEVNDFSKKLTRKIFTFMEELNTYYGSGFLASIIEFDSQIVSGKAVGATPDGREAFSPLCDSMGAIFGKDDRGPTALLNSAASIYQDKLAGTPVLNFNLDAELNDDILKALILGYFASGGYQMQITCASRETLMEAYEHPDMHRNLVVRVGGYSEYFRLLSDEHKKMIINRSIQDLSGQKV